MYLLGHFLQILHMSAAVNQKKKKKQFCMDTTIPKPQVRYIEMCAFFLFRHYNFGERFETQESFQKLVEFDRSGERSPE